VRDTLDAGAGLCDEPVVRLTVEDAPRRLKQLLEWGMSADLLGGGRSGSQAPVGEGFPGLALGREGGHSRSRIVHANGDATGRELAVTLERQVRGNDRIRVFTQCFVLDFITLDGVPPRCVGAITHHPKFGLQVIWAKATILASGGCGQVYRETTNPPAATGDGLAAAYRAGAKVADMAFMQFHPTTLYVAGASRHLISEAVRGEGAVLIDRGGVRFMKDYHALADLAPRDVVSRAILAQLAKTQHTHVFLDCRAIGGERFAQRFPGIHQVLRNFELDPGTDPIPVYPSAHYMIGGVLTDDWGRTTLRGLHACGEVACTGLHGANRLASNSLLEGLVFGVRSAHAALECLQDPGSNGKPPRIISDIPLSQRSELDLSDVRSSLRSVLWRHVGIERSGDRLVEVGEMCDFWARYTLDKIFDDRVGWETQNLLMVAAMITRAALWRAESRGTHYRVDQPATREEFRVHDVWQRGSDTPETLPVRGAAGAEVR
jgi:L-aspartate oxidase